jgi:hypothetical protein
MEENDYSLPEGYELAVFDTGPDENGQCWLFIQIVPSAETAADAYADETLAEEPNGTEA